MSDVDRILLTGATGYVGGRLLARLQNEGLPLRCLARHPEHLSSRVRGGTEVVRADLLRRETVAGSMDGVHTAYYLVHSMSHEGEFAALDRLAVENFLGEARRARVRRIVYLGGLGDPVDLSDHLASRQEVGRILRTSGIPTVEFRASIIIGSGSLSFEMIRALVEKLPVMVTPRWVRTLAQPIAIEDVIDFLRGALDLPESTNRVMEIGGRDRASYQEIMSEYARQRGLRRWMLPVPVLSPGLSSLWLGLVTPLYARVGRALVESLRNETVVSDPASGAAFRIPSRGLSESIARALKNEDKDFASTRWCDAVSACPRPTEPLRKRVGARLVDSRAIRVATDDASAFRPIREIGGRRGWYALNWLWRLRGLLDLMLGGPGMRRGRRDPHMPEPGDTIDFWRVEAFEPDHLLRLSAEMRLPGRAWLQFEVRPDAGATIIRQTAEFEPRGLGGNLYWYALYPAHQWIFRSMLSRIGAHACGGGG
jgi:uncharacterized protein YbjT (DUF2867 family)